MTKNEIEEIKKVSAIAMKDNPDWRKGQALWNVAEAYVYEKGSSEQVYRFEELRASDKDCFHMDEKIDLFLNALTSV